IGSRYLDVLILGLFLNALILVWLLPHWSGWRRVVCSAAAVMWLAWVGAGLWNYNSSARIGAIFRYQHGQALEQRRVIREFLVSDDPTVLRNFANTSYRFNNFDLTLVVLRDPKIRLLLPPSLTPDGRAGPLSKLAPRLASLWPGLLVLGLLGLVGGALRV